MVALVIAGALLPLAPAFATSGTLTSKSVTLSNSEPSTQSNYTFSFTTGSSATLNVIDFQYATTPSGGITVPTGLVLTSATLSTTTGIGTGWSLASTSGGELSITNATPQVVGGSTAVTVAFQTITNPQIGGASGCTEANSNANTGTCFARVATYTGTTTLVDSGSASYELVSPTTASVTVDPALTMVLAGLASGTVTSGGTLTATSTYNTLPFGNITANQSALAGQSVTVTTNALSGYTVSMAMTTGMTGTSGKVLQPFEANSASWATPVAWTAPTGSNLTTPGSTTASFIGANTSDTRVSGWSSPTGKWAPVDSTYNTVDESTAPDNGTTVNITYQVETDVYQPADTYTGTLQYNAVATY